MADRGIYHIQHLRAAAAFGFGSAVQDRQNGNQKDGGDLPVNEPVQSDSVSASGLNYSTITDYVQTARRRFWQCLGIGGAEADSKTEPDKIPDKIKKGKAACFADFPYAFSYFFINDI